MKIYDFEVAGIQLNGFHHAKIYNVDIGPSLQNVPLTAYYSNARYLVLAMTKLLNGIDEQNLEMPTVSFSYLSAGEIFDPENKLTLKQIKDNLVESMDIIFKYYTSKTSINLDENSKIFKNAMKIFNNNNNLPHGSAMYGIILNSYSVAVNDFGNSINDGIRQGNNIIMANITLHDMSLSTKEVIGVNFIDCHRQNYRSSPKVTLAPIPAPAPTKPPSYESWFEWYQDYYNYFYYSDDEEEGRRRRLAVEYDNEYQTVSTGPFGDVMDITEMIPTEQIDLVTDFDGTQDISQLDYIGNPLSDAQIALYLYGNYLDDGRNYAYTSFISQYLLSWAVRGMRFPNVCPIMVRNRDNMAQVNKGIVGIRMDGIEGAVIDNITITDLSNSAPITPVDDKNVRGISVIDGDLLMTGTNVISNLESWYGLSTGLDVMDHTSMIDYEEGSRLDISNLISKSKVSSDDDGSIFNDGYFILGLVAVITLICISCICTYILKNKEKKMVKKRDTKSSWDEGMPPSVEIVPDISSAYEGGRVSRI